MDVLRYVTRQPEVLKKCFFAFFLGGTLYDEISKVSISRELYVILDWLTFQNDPTTHLSISA